jgi:hypothetical protein
VSGYVLIVDVCAFVLAIIGFNMAFRQNTVRRYLGRPAQLHEPDEDEDALTYVLRIAGVMIMTFGLAIGVMVTLFNLA